MVSAVSAVAALGLGIRNARLQAARTWPTLVEEVSELSTDELRTAVEGNPWVAEVVGLAWEEAARTSSEQKRRFLARVAAAALRYGPLTDKVQSLPFLIRTVANLEPAHIHVMIAIATAASDYEVPAAAPQRDPIAERALGPLRTPIYGQLEHEGLIEQSDRISGRITEYGWEFLAFLGQDEPDARLAYLDWYSISRDGSSGTLILINFGAAPVIMTDVRAELWDEADDVIQEKPAELHIQKFAPQPLEPRAKYSLDFYLPKRSSKMLRSYRDYRLVVRLKSELADGRQIKAVRRIRLPSFDEKCTWGKLSAINSCSALREHGLTS